MGFRFLWILWGMALGACASAPRSVLSNHERALLLVDVGNAALMEGDYVAALQSLLEAEKLDSDIPELHHSKSLVFIGRKELEIAENEAKQAVLLKPSLSEAQNTLGKILIDRNRSEEAIPHLRIAAADPLFRDSYKPQTNLGAIYFTRGDLEKASEYFSKAIDSSPSNACVAYYYRGTIQMKKGRFRPAVQDLEKSIRRFCTNFREAHLALGIAYQQINDYTLARKKFLEIQNRFPGTEVADQALARLREIP